MSRCFLGAILIFLFFVAPSFAGAVLPSEIEQHFAPVSCSIIMPIADEYLIDLDSSANLSIGDILTLVAPGEEVLHPITKEVLGTIDLSAGFMQVTRIESGFSYVRPLVSTVTPQKGDLLRRFDHVPSRFFAKQNKGADLYRDLKQRLPQLKWLPQGSVEEPLLFFTLDGNTLSVTNASDTLLYSYDLAETQPESTGPDTE